jgi:hypothetical protein
MGTVTSASASAATSAFAVTSAATSAFAVTSAATSAFAVTTTAPTSASYIPGPVTDVLFRVEEKGVGTFKSVGNVVAALTVVATFPIENVRVIFYLASSAAVDATTLGVEWRRTMTIPAVTAVTVGLDTRDCDRQDQESDTCSLHRWAGAEWIWLCGKITEIRKESCNKSLAKDRSALFRIGLSGFYKTREYLQLVRNVATQVLAGCFC